MSAQTSPVLPFETGDMHSQHSPLEKLAFPDESFTRKALDSRCRAHLTCSTHFHLQFAFHNPQ